MKMSMSRRATIMGTFALAASAVPLASVCAQSTSMRVTELSGAIEEASRKYVAHWNLKDELENLALEKYPPAPPLLKKWGPFLFPLPFPINRKFYTECDRQALLECGCVSTIFREGEAVEGLCPKTLAHRDALIACLDERAAQMRVVDVSVGLIEAEELGEKISGRYYALLEEIEALPINSVDVLRVKAVAYLSLHPAHKLERDNDTNDNRLLHQLITGLAALA